MRAVLIVLNVLLFGCGLALGDTSLVEERTSPIPEIRVPSSPSIEGQFTRASVAADSGTCSEIGTRILQRQCGSAIDAGIATVLCAGVLGAQSAGIGGGHFLTYYERSTGRSHVVIARETAPSAATQDLFLQPGTSSTEGGLSIAVPGEVRGLYEAWKIGGKLPWRELFQPTIELCRMGFPVPFILADAITRVPEDVYERQPNLRILLTNPETGDFFKEGEIMKRLKLADTLEAIAEEGPDAFYDGSLTDDIVAEITNAGGIITKEDLRNYRAVRKDPVVITLFDGSTIYSPPPPSSGAVYEYILNILNGYKLDSDSVSTIEKATLTFHRIVEAFKHAFARRSDLGDLDVNTPEFKENIQKVLKNLTDLSFGETIRNRIDDSRTFNTDFYEPAFEIQVDVSDASGGTSHLSLLAPNGDAVAITSTINLRFGSKVVGSRTGIIYNNEMDDFSTPGVVNSFGVVASPANFIIPGKRPLSSMSPSIVTDRNGDVKLVVGSSGGTTIITATALTTIETLWFKWGIKDAIDFPVIHHQLLPPEILLIEDIFPEVLLTGLRSKGHNITVVSFLNTVQGVLSFGKGKIFGNSDFRKRGAADGFCRI